MMNVFLYSLGFVLLMSISDQPETQKMLMCQCTITKSVSADEVMKQRDVYTWLIRGENGQACCSGEALSDHKAYHEIWKSNSREHPDVFKREVFEETEGYMAQRLGCREEEPMLRVTDIEQFPQPAKEYYPELAKE